MLFNAIVEVRYYMSLPYDTPTGDLYSKRFRVVCDSEDYEAMAAIALQKLLDYVIKNYLDEEMVDYTFNCDKFAHYQIARDIVIVSSYNIYDKDCDIVLAETHD